MRPWIESALAEYHGLSFSRHQRLTRRVALTFRATVRPTPSGYVAYDAWRLFVLGFRWCPAPALPRSRAPLAVYRPVIDLVVEDDGVVTGTGRIGFRPDRVYDLVARYGVRRVDPGRDLVTARLAVALARAVEDVEPYELVTCPVLPRFYWAFDRDRPPVHDPANGTADAFAAAECTIDGRRAWPAEFFVARPGTRYVLHPVDGSPDPWGEEAAASGMAAPEGAVRHGSWFLRDGVAYPNPQPPAAVYVDFAPFAGRRVRNPAHDVLKRMGIIPDETFPQFRNQFGRVIDAQRTFPAPEYTEEVTAGGPRAVPVNAPARLLARLTGDDALLCRMLAELRAACDQLGIPVPAGAPGDERLAEMLATPYAAVSIADAPPIQVLGLDGIARPDRLTFADATLDLDLYDLGDEFAAVPPAGSRRQGSRREGAQTWQRRS
jgi:hypothetical protein